MGPMMGGQGYGVSTGSSGGYSGQPPWGGSGSIDSGGGGRAGGALITGGTEQQWMGGEPYLASPPGVIGPPIIPNLHLYQSSLQAFCLALANMKARGRVDNFRLVSMLNAWGLYNSRNNVDVTLGMSSMILRMMSLHQGNISGASDPNAEPLQQPDREVHDGLDRTLPYHIAKVI